MISVIIVMVRKRKLFDPHDYNCDAYNAAFDAAYDYHLRLTLGLR